MRPCATCGAVGKAKHDTSCPRSRETESRSERRRFVNPNGPDTTRVLLRRHLYWARKTIGELAQVWDMRPDSARNIMMVSSRRPLLAWHVDKVADWLALDDFDRTELHRDGPTLEKIR